MLRILHWTWLLMLASMSFVMLFDVFYHPSWWFQWDSNYGLFGWWMTYPWWVYLLLSIFFARAARNYYREALKK